MIKKHGVKMIDFRFTDLPGQWQHFSIPVNQFEEEMFEEGLGFDGSSIRGWQSINESDMLIMPDPTTANIDPFIQMKSL
jgi:glutamine synthetase